MTTRERRPNLFIVGAMKCGTTAWYEYLRSHSDIFMPDLKEPGYFARDVPNWRMIRTEKEYAALFADAGSATVVGEGSTVYLMSETAAEAIHDYNPDAKILIFLRDQEDYLPSLHNENRFEFAEDIDDFETAWRLSGRRPVPPTASAPKALDYPAMGRFYEQVSRYLDVFPADQVRVAWFRDWIADPRPTYLGILRYLGVKDDGRSEFPRLNEGVRFRSRKLVRLLHNPPPSVRRIARLFKLVTGLQAAAQEKIVARTVSMLSARGYRKSISRELAEEIRRHYAQDNGRLNELLISRGALLGSGDPS